MLKLTWSIASLVVVGGCASYPAPVQHMADAQASARGAVEVGAATNPQAQLHLKLAQEELSRAARLMNDGDNKRADYVLIRAKADAELALALAREVAAENGAQHAIQDVTTAETNPTAPAVTTTTTTSASTNHTPPTEATTTTTTTTNGGQK